MKLIKRILTILSISSIICINFILPVFADKKINEDILIQIYDKQDLLYQPGAYEKVGFTIENKTDKDMSIKKIYFMEKSRVNGINMGKAFEEMAKHTTIIIEEQGNEDNKVSSNLNNILGENNGINLPQFVGISPNEKKDFILTVDMDEAMNNDAQGISRVFSLGVIYNLDSNGGVINPDEPSNPDTDNPTKPDKPEIDNVDDNLDNSTDRLPQTGGIINSTSLTLLGMAVVGLGIVLDKKSSNKGGKSDE